MIAYADPASFADALQRLPSTDAQSRLAASDRQASLTKPLGALGRLEEIAVFMAGWQCQARPHLDTVQAVVFAGNHGVATQGVSAYPAEVTQQMVANFNAGGAAINALTRACGADLSIVALDLARPTGDITQEPAMSEDECLDALNQGAAALKHNAQLLLVGEMGIANTTPAAALSAVAIGGDLHDWIGRGTGVDDAGLTRKTNAVKAAIALHGPYCTNAFETLRRLGGREIAAMAGAILAARLARIPVLLDGFIASASIAPLVRDNQRLTQHCIAAHRSAETGHAHILRYYGLEPLLTLGLRLGEGTGAALAVPILRGALMAHNEMATFEEAAVAHQ